jgi:hypothetical protein
MSLSVVLDSAKSLHGLPSRAFLLVVRVSKNPDDEQKNGYSRGPYPLERYAMTAAAGLARSEYHNKPE